MKYYVYKHINKNTNEVFYIGKGCGKRAWNKSQRNSYWHRYTKKNDYIIEIVKKDLSEDEAYNLEVKLIGEIGLDKLTNIQPGGKIEIVNYKPELKIIDIIIDDSDFDDNIKKRLKNLSSWK